MVLLLLGLGCTVQAPEDIEAMMTFGFQELEEDSPAAMEALADNLIPWMDAHFEETAEGYAIDSLSSEHLAGAGLDVTLDEDGIIGAMVGVDYAVTIDQLADGLTWPDQEEIFTGYLEYDVVEVGDRACFLAMDCPWFEMHEDVHADLKVLGIESWHHAVTHNRWVELDDGRRAVVTRTLGPDPVTFNVDYLEIDQQYSFTFAYERPDGTVRRAQAAWAEGRVVGADLPEGFQVNTAVSTMIRAAGEMEAFLNGEVEAE